MTITPIYAGALTLIFLWLTLNVTRSRGASGVSLGDGGDPLLQRRIRAHGNFAEYVPLALVLIALAEFGGASPWLLHALGLTLTVARLMHGFALSSLTLRPVHRIGGAALTLIVLLVAAIWCLQYGIRILQGP